MSEPKRGLPSKLKMRHQRHFVEELTTRHGEPVGRMLPIDAIEPDPDQPRSAMGDLAELARSIRDKGVLEPILVRPANPGAPDSSSYRLVSGERRFRAASDAGLVEIPAIIMDVGEEEALEIALIENLQRKDLTPFEEGEGYRALASRHGYTHEQISRAVGKSRTVVTESLKLLDMPPRARAAVEALGITSKSLLLEVLKAADDETDLLALLERAADKGLTRDDLRDEKRSPQRRSGTARRAKPYTFRFRAPDKTFNLALSFRKSEVDRADLITALEQILSQLRESSDS